MQPEIAELKSLQRILIANRGEIATRIARTAADMGIATVGVYSEDDTASLHTRSCDLSVPLDGRGVKAYLDMIQLIHIARDNGCDAIHPGYGFLSENTEFSRRCREAGLCFVGASPEVLEQLGDKAQARRLSLACDVPLPRGLNHSANLDEVKAFYASLPSGLSIMIKALAGGGGRGMAAVRGADGIEAAYQRCQNEAELAFGNGALYAEQLVEAARHIEVQVLGDGTGAVNHLWERECSLQRRNQKLLEVAPSPSLDESSRRPIIEAALRMAAQIKYQGLGTFEFLVDAADPARFYFMEANPRIQVEHTVTEEITGLDLVQIQLQLAAGNCLREIGMDCEQPRSGAAVQVRINLETLNVGGAAKPAVGQVSAFQAPAGPGIRVDHNLYSGYRAGAGFDAMAAKLIVRAADYASALPKCHRALRELQLQGVDSNRSLLLNLLTDDAVIANQVTTGYVESALGKLLREQRDEDRFFPAESKTGEDASSVEAIDLPEDCESVASYATGVLVSFEVAEGDEVHAGQTIAIVEAMKMEFPIKADVDGIVEKLLSREGDSVIEAQWLAFIRPSVVTVSRTDCTAVDLDYIRSDLAEVVGRNAAILDEQRPEAVAKRHARGQLTIREKINGLVDQGSFNEYGGLLLAGQRKRHTEAELEKLSPADGIVTGTGTVNAVQFAADKSRCLVLGYDYTVFSGSQGLLGHEKTDRMLHLAQEQRLPIVLFAEGIGGRAQDTDFNMVAGLYCHTFANMSKMSGLAPTVGIATGNCFAGNAVLYGVCDVTIATRNASIGIGGPAMIEGAGLGIYRADEVGPVSMQGPNGVVDIAVEDETAAVAVAKKYLSYFQGNLPQWQRHDQRKLRHIIPQDRKQIYDIREVIEVLADMDSVLELRRDFAPGVVTALVRIEGKPYGLFANDTRILGGAIDAAGGDKIARFQQLCDAYDIPLISLCDCPGYMVGPHSEKEATVRHVCRVANTSASLTVPFVLVLLRKAFGLGAVGMSRGSFHGNTLTVSWPTGVMGGMGIEGAVSMVLKKQLAQIEDLEERQRVFDHAVAQGYEQGKALNVAKYLEVDAVIDPAETVGWIQRAMATAPPPKARDGKKRNCIDTW